MKKQDLYNSLIDKFGSVTQLIVTIEELSELQKAITKLLRDKITQDNITAMTEEIADVEIMLEQVKQLFKISEEVEHQKGIKLIRTEQRYFTKQTQIC